MPTVTTSDGLIVPLSGTPEICPYCHRNIMPVPVFGYHRQGNLDVFFRCPNIYCDESFIGYYEVYPNTGQYNFLEYTSQGKLEGKEFNLTITTISPDFVTIYNQAYKAEQQELLEICGVGYRKALEFLIKDYIIQNKPEERAKVEKKLLGACITEYVSDSKVKSVASRAAWLGNDETHYVRKWEGKDLKDLKKLIDLTVHWIEAEVITKSFEDEMPE